jgi:hypothetical protein
MSSLARVTPSIRTLSIPEINRVLAQRANAIYAGQGKAGGTTIEDDLTVPSLHVGAATIDDDLLANLDGFAARPVAPFIPGEKTLVDNVTAGIFQVEQTAAYANQHGLIFYEIDVFQTNANRAQGETGLLTYTGAMASPAAISGTSATTGVSQALTPGTLLTTFSTVDSADFFTVTVNANTSLAAANLIRIRYWVWPSHGTIRIL